MDRSNGSNWYLKISSHFATLSTWCFYFNISMMFIFLLFKYRGLKFLYSNPGLYYSGFLDDSKGEIDQLLGEMDTEFSLKSDTIDQNLDLVAKQERFEQVMQSQALSFPIVLKPDQGQRGLGVKIIYDLDSAIKYLSSADFDIIVQEYSNLPYEMGLYFYRDPISDEYKIFSATVKRFFYVTGDGQSNLDQLYAQQPMLEKMKQDLAESYAIDWNLVLKKDEIFEPTVPPCRSVGASIEDVTHLIPEQLEWLTQIAQQIQHKGVHIGRFDLKFRNIVDFIRGRNIKVIELNGGSAESVNVYDRKKGFVESYMLYFKQLELVFQVGANNLQNSPQLKTSTLTFLRNVARYFRKNKKMVDMDQQNFDWSKAIRISQPKEHLHYLAGT